MATRTAVGLIIIIVGAMLFMSAWLYPQLPETVVSHWGANGAPNGMMPKFWGLFFLPLLTAGIVLLVFCLPYLDPLRKNIESFRSIYNTFVVGLALFLLYVHSLTLLWNTGTYFDMGRALLPALGVGMYGLGMMLRHTKRNWFIGIRTPWTLSSDRVWEKTHALGSTLFETVGALIVLSALFIEGRYYLWIILVPILAAAGAVVVYSYVLYGREKKS
ncbi:MAG TPA: SdpI family protein [Candidatus Paceibacterota bacterium]|nr:SdpI family protein [Candidatus Paceibacterota bacterium]